MQYVETVRSPQQVAFDLGNALAFSMAELKAYRQGILPPLRLQTLLGRVLKPLLLSACLTLLPLLACAYLTSRSHDCSWSEGLNIVFSNVLHLRDVAAVDGWFRVILYVAGGLLFLGLGCYQASRIPLDLLSDALSKQVLCAEGRVSAREEEKLGRGKRDEVVKYIFEMKEHVFEVSRRAFLALDNGGLYRVYFLPRSNTLLAIEPSVLAKDSEGSGRPQTGR